jgi:hypothetical protein
VRGWALPPFETVRERMKGSRVLTSKTRAIMSNHSK